MGAPWRDWPPDPGAWNNMQRRFIRWRDKGIWEKLPEIVIIGTNRWRVLVNHNTKFQSFPQHRDVPPKSMTQVIKF